jgi:Na+-transporting methylmalonyl-CoA/oxaloacetate decarboxylase gamma subunit
VITGLVVVFAFVGVVFLGYVLVIGAVALMARWIYMFFKSKKAARESGIKTETVFEQGHVEVGDFSRGPGRIIDHTDD